MQPGKCTVTVEETAMICRCWY